MRDLTGILRVSRAILVNFHVVDPILTEAALYGTLNRTQRVAICNVARKSKETWPASKAAYNGSRC